MAKARKVASAVYTGLLAALVYLIEGTLASSRPKFLSFSEFFGERKAGHLAGTGTKITDQNLVGLPRVKEITSEETDLREYRRWP